MYLSKEERQCTRPSHPQKTSLGRRYSRSPKQLYKHTINHTHIHPYIQTYIHAYIQIYMHTYIRKHLHTCIHKYRTTVNHTYRHTDAQATQQTYIQSYMHSRTETNHGDMFNRVEKSDWATFCPACKPLKVGTIIFWSTGSGSVDQIIRYPFLLFLVDSQTMQVITVSIGA